MLSSAGHSINYQLNMRNNRIYSNFSAPEQVELLSKFPESTVYLINPPSFYNLTRRERLCIFQTDWLDTALYNQYLYNQYPGYYFLGSVKGITSYPFWIFF